MESALDVPDISLSINSFDGGGDQSKYDFSQQNFTFYDHTERSYRDIWIHLLA